jgi:hypothetical protein
MNGRVFVGMDPGGTGRPGFLLERNGGVIYELPIATRYYAIGDPDIPMPGAIPRDLWRVNAPRAEANYPIPENEAERQRHIARANALRVSALLANALREEGNFIVNNAERREKKAATEAANAAAKAAKTARTLAASGSAHGGRRTRVKRRNRSSKRKN